MTEREVEQWLEAMPLARPSASLDGRIASSAARLRRRRGPIGRIGWMAGVSGLAAGLLIGVMAWPLLPWSGQADEPRTEVASNGPSVSGRGGASNATAPNGETAEEEPIEATVSTTQVVDEGVVMLEDGPARKIRRVTTRQMLYYDESANERVEVTVPEEEVYFVAPESF